MNGATLTPIMTKRAMTAVSTPAFMLTERVFDLLEGVQV